MILFYAEGLPSAFDPDPILKEDFFEAFCCFNIFGGHLENLTLPEVHRPKLAPIKDNSNTVALPKLGLFLDYRKYLAAFYLAKREQTKNNLRPYTYSVFAASADIKSPNYLKMVIDGIRNVSEDMVDKFAKALGLSKSETAEFHLMVKYSQAVDPTERNLALKDLSEMRIEQKLQAGEIDRKAWEKLPSWVAWVVYALIDQKGVSFDPIELHRTLRGKARPEEIQMAIQSLIESGEAVMDPVTNRLVKAKPTTDGSEEIPVALIRKLQSQLMLLGLESLHNDDPTEREFGTLTLSLTKAEFEEIRFKLRQIRKQFHKDTAIRRMTEPGDRVYQINLQVFPVTEVTDK